MAPISLAHPSDTRSSARRASTTAVTSGTPALGMRFGPAMRAHANSAAARRSAAASSTDGGTPSEARSLSLMNVRTASASTAHACVSYLRASVSSGASGCERCACARDACARKALASHCSGIGARSGCRGDGGGNGGACVERLLRTMPGEPDLPSCGEHPGGGARRRVAEPVTGPGDRLRLRCAGRRAVLDARMAALALSASASAIAAGAHGPGVGARAAGPATTGPAASTGAAQGPAARTSASCRAR